MTQQTTQNFILANGTRNADYAMMNEKSQLNEYCHTLFAQPPNMQTHTNYTTRVWLPDGTTHIYNAPVHADSQRGAARIAINHLLAPNQINTK